MDYEVIIKIEEKIQCKQIIDIPWAYTLSEEKTTDFFHKCLAGYVANHLVSNTFVPHGARVTVYDNRGNLTHGIVRHVVNWYPTENN